MAAEATTAVSRMFAYTAPMPLATRVKRQALGLTASLAVAAVVGRAGEP